MRGFVRGFACFLASLLAPSVPAGAQHSDCASVKQTDDEVTLRAESWDPVLTISRTLADRYGVSVSVEDPKWAYPGDTEDVADASPAFSAQHGGIHYALMKRHAVEIQFSTSGKGWPTDVSALLRQLADAANKEMPYGYRVDVNGADYALVPTTTRNSKDEIEPVLPLLDRHVTIPAGTRSIAEHAALMADQLSRQTGLHVSCCQAVVLGVAWGSANVSFQANDMPAREVLRALIRLEQQASSQASNTYPVFDHWTVTCDGTGAPWCFIEVARKFTAQCRERIVAR